MKRRSCVALLLLTFCGGAMAEAQLPEAPGKQVVQRVCTQCHTLSYVTDVKRTRAQWAYQLSIMRALGAPLGEEDAELVLNYLVAHFGK